MQKLLSVTLIAVLCYLHTTAQVDTTAANADTIQSGRHSYFKARLSYLSNSVYNGRKDSLQVPYLTPTLEYFDKSGLFAKASISYLVSNYAQRIDLYQLEAGYQFELLDNFSGSISGSKPFYNSSSVSVRSQTKGELDADFSWTIAHAISFNGGAGYIFTPGLGDKFFNTGLSHEFVFGKNKQWSIEPAVTANFSTRNYYEQYKNNRRLKTGKIKKRQDSTVINTGNQTVVVTTTITTLNANKLQLMDSEVSLSAYYDAGKWSFFATPTLAIPTNPATYITNITTSRTLANNTITHDSRSETSTEKIGNVFYMEAGVSYRF